MNSPATTAPLPLPRVARFESLAFGLFLHYGLYSQLARGEWAQLVEGVSRDQAGQMRDKFTASEFDAREIARLARRAGAKYCTLTARHHDGFSLYDTRGLSDFDSMQSPAGRDLIGEFVEACRAEEIVPFIYHTTLDWRWESHCCDGQKFDAYLEYLRASVEILCKNYGPLGGFWFDGNWSRKADWKESQLYSMIRQHQPDAIINDNSGLGWQWQERHPELDCMAIEQAMPKSLNWNGWKKHVAGEVCQTLNAHWGIAARDFNYLSPAQVIENLVNSRKVGANYQANFGPAGSGRIPDYERAALEIVGQWLAINGRAIYTTKPSALRCQGRDFVLEGEGKLFYFAMDLAITGHENVTVAVGGTGPRSVRGLSRSIRNASWLDNGERIHFLQARDQGYATLNLTGYPYGTHLVVRVAEIEVDPREG